VSGYKIGRKSIMIKMVMKDLNKLTLRLSKLAEKAENLAEKELE
jgi:hypothetical protein